MFGLFDLGNLLHMLVWIREVRYFLYMLEFNLLAIVVGRKLYVYKYDMKKLAENQPILPFKEIVLTESVKFLQVAKDGNICLFYDKKVEIFLVGEDVRKRFDKPYPKP
jgi:hypothetical protein